MPPWFPGTPIQGKITLNQTDLSLPNPAQDLPGPGLQWALTPGIWAVSKEFHAGGPS